MGSKKEFINEPLATHYNPVTDQENKKGLKKYESVGVHLKAFDMQKILKILHTELIIMN